VGCLLSVVSEPDSPGPSAGDGDCCLEVAGDTEDVLLGSTDGGFSRVVDG
jgi:hypothetical protein